MFHPRRRRHALPKKSVLRATRGRSINLEALESRQLLTALVAESPEHPAFDHVSTLVLHPSKPTKKSHTPVGALAAHLAGAPDATGTVTVIGTSIPKAHVQVDSGPGGPLLSATKADKHGHFTLSFKVGFGTTTLHVVATLGKKVAAADLVVNRPAPAPPPAQTPPATTPPATTPPAIVVTAVSPASPANSNPTITGRVTETAPGAVTLTEQLDTAAPVPVALDAAGNFQIVAALAVDGSADGPHAVTLRALGPANTAATPATISFTLDTRPPVVTVNSPLPNLLTRVNPAIAGTANDSGSGLALATASLDNGAPSPLALDPAGHFSLPISLPLDGSADGRHQVAIQANDRAGNRSQPVQVVFTLDTIPPAVPTFDLDPATDSPPIGDDHTTFANVILDGRTSPNVSVALAPTGSTTTSDATGQFRFAGVALALGANMLTVTATDAVGNSSAVSKTITRLSPVVPNKPPVLDPVSDLTVMPGQRLTVKLHATDSDGDTISYFLLSDSSIPTGKLAADGLILFAPAPGDIGTYHLTGVASDGTLEATQPFTLNVVADPVTTTRVSGVIQAADQTPLADAKVAIGPVTTTTAADGSFTLDLGSGPTADSLTVFGDQIAGALSYPRITEPLSLFVGHALYSSVNNALTRPIYLTPVDTANAVMIDPSKDITVTTPAIPGARLVVRAGTLLNSDGTLYSGPLSLQAISPDRTPVPLPADVNPVELYTIQPAGLIFKQPPAISLPNPGGYKPGVAMALSQQDSNTGQFNAVGDGNVSPDGKTVNSGPPGGKPIPGTGDLIRFNAGKGIIDGLNPPDKDWQLKDPKQDYWKYYQPITDLKGPRDWVIIPPEEQFPPLFPPYSETPPPPEDYLPPILIPPYIPPPPPPSDPAPLPGEPHGPIQVLGGAQQLENSAGISVDDGNLTASISLTQYQVQGATQGLNLYYDSQRANPNAVVTLSGQYNNSAFPNDSAGRVVAALSLVRGGFVQEVGGSGNDMYGTDGGANFWSLPAASGAVETGIGAKLGSLPTGTYNFSLRAGIERFTGTALDGDTTTTQGTLSIVNERQGPFGSGWQLGGYQWITVNPDGSALLADGNGSELEFGAPTTTGSTSTFVTRAGEFSTLVRNADGTFQRTELDQTVSTFDATGKLTTVVDRNGNTTRCLYDGAGRLIQVVDPLNQITTLTYNGSQPQVTSVTDPAGRVSQLFYDTSGNLIKVVAPDNSARTWQYDDAHRLTTLTDPVNNSTTYGYDFLGGVQQATLADGSTSTFASALSHGIFPPDQTQAPAQPPAILAAPATITGTATDPNGHATQVTFDSSYQVQSVADSAGAVETILRDPNGLIVHETDPRGDVLVYTYDGKGNLVSSRSTLSTTSLVRGALAGPGQIDQYTFTASAGERIYYNALTKLPAGDSAHLIKPDGGEEFTFDGGTRDFGPYAAAESGTYTIKFTGTVAASYSFQVLDATGAVPLPVGQTRSGSIDPTLGVDVYRYDGQAGTRLSIRDLIPVAAASSGTPRVTWTVYGPDNQPLSNDLGSLTAYGSTFVATLPSDGTYVIVGSIGSGTSAATYRVAFDTPPAITQPLAFDTDTTATFAQPGSRVAYTFSGTPGQELLFWPESDASGVRVQLAAPGAAPAVIGPGTPPLFLEASGTYTLFVDGLGASTFAFRLATASTLPALVLGAPISGAVDSEHPRLAYAFTGSAGQRVKFRTLSYSQSQGALLTLFGPSGQSLDSYAIGGQFTRTLPADGTYVVSVTNLGIAGSSSASFQFEADDVSDAPTQVSGLGVMQSGTVTAGSASHSTFTAPAGHLVFLNTLAMSPGLTITLADPTSATVVASFTAQNLGPILLPRSGTYTVTVQGSNPIVTGSFQYRVIDLAAAPVLTLGSLVNQTFPSGFQADVYRFTGQAGQQIFYNALDSDGDRVNVTLYGPTDLILSQFIGAGSVFTQDAETNKGPLTLTQPGTYYLVLASTQPTGGHYEFRLLDTAAAPLLADDTLTNDQLDTLTTTKLYRISGTAGERLFATFPGSSAQVEGQLFGPGTDPMASVFFPGIGLYQPLPVDGTYLLAVSAGGTTSASVPITYSLRTSSGPATTSALTLGTATTVTIAAPGQRIELTFSATAGQRFYFDGLDPSNARAFVYLFSPGGSVSALQIFATDLDSFQFYTAPTTGTYQLEVSSDQPGNYHFAFSDVDAAPNVPLDTLVPGHLGSARQTQLFLLQGTAGERLTFAHAADPSHPFRGQWSLDGPDGAGLTTGIESLGNSIDFIATLPTSGPYVLMLTDPSASAPEDFNFEVYTAAINVTAAALGTTYTGTVSKPGEQDTYTFTGTAGQRLYLDNLEPFALGTIPQLAVRQPDGTLVRPRDISGDIPLLLIQAGTYQVLAPGNDGFTGAYSFRLLNADAAPSVAPSQSANGSLAVNGADVYTLTGATGQRFHFHMSATSGTTTGSTWALYDSNFHQVASAGLANDFDTTLPAAGTYLLVLSNANPTSVGYSFVVTPVADTPVMPMGFGVTQSGTLAAGMSTSFTYAAPAGLPIYFDHQLADLGFLSVSFTGPGGATIFGGRNFDAGPFVLPASGSYTATVVNTDPANSGAYAFRILDLTTAVPLQLGSTVQSTLGGNFSVDVYSFAGQAGQRLFFDSIVGSAGSSTIQLVAPDGQVRMLKSDPNAPKDPPFTLTATGTYYVFVNGQQAQGTDYSFRLWDVGTAPALTFGQPTNGQLSPSTEANVFAFAGSAGESTYFESLSVSQAFAATWILYAPDNTVLGSFNELDSTFSDVLPTSGTYFLVIARSTPGSPLTYSIEALEPPLNSATIAVQAGLSGSASYTYDPSTNQLTSATDTLGRQVVYEIDSVTGNRLSEAAVGAAAGGADLVTHFLYTAHGLLASLTDPLGNVTSFQYDSADRVISTTDPLGTVSYTFDAAGNLATATDRDGRTRRFVYDALNRRTEEDWLDAAGGVLRSIRYTYDPAGRLTSVSDPDSSYTYTYDANGRVASVSNAGTPNTPTVVISNEYDAAGNRIARSDTIGGVAAGATSYTYDGRNRETQVTQSGGGAAAKRVDLTYDAAGDVIGIARSADLAGTQSVAGSTFAYDAAGRLTSLVHTSGTATLDSFGLAYDAAGRITSITSPDGTTTYSHDESGQLTAANHSTGPNESYAYDAGGNRIDAGVQIGSADRLLSDGTFNYTYDAEGNLVSRTNMSSQVVDLYSYDYRQRLTRVQTENAQGATVQQVDYTYDVFNRRIARLFSGPLRSTIARTVYDGANIAYVFDGSGTITHRALYGPAVDQLLADDTGAGGIFWTLADHEGSVRDVITSSGTVIDHINYDSFGKILSESHPTIELLAAFAGRPLDRATGLYDMRARTYDPTTGRFLTQDPIGVLGGDSDLYRYAGNDPIDRIDPSGNTNRGFAQSPDRRRSWPDWYGG
jgi:RHS repeat-associated protein